MRQEKSPGKYQINEPQAETDKLNLLRTIVTGFKSEQAREQNCSS